MAVDGRPNGLPISRREGIAKRVKKPTISRAKRRRLHARVGRHRRGALADGLPPCDDGLEFMVIQGCQVQ